MKDGGSYDDDNDDDDDDPEKCSRPHGARKHSGIVCVARCLWRRGEYARGRNRPGAAHGRERSA